MKNFMFSIEEYESDSAPKSFKDEVKQILVHIREAEDVTICVDPFKNKLETTSKVNILFYDGEKNLLFKTHFNLIRKEDENLYSIVIEELDEHIIYDYYCTKLETIN